MRLRVAMKVVKAFAEAGRWCHRPETIKRAFIRADRALAVHFDGCRGRKLLDWYARIFDPQANTPTPKTGG